MEDIEKDILFESNQSVYNFYYVVIPFEIFIGYNFIFDISISRSVNEGILKKQSVHMILWAVIFSMSAYTAYWLSKYISKKISNYWGQNFAIIAIF